MTFPQFFLLAAVVANAVIVTGFIYLNQKDIKRWRQLCDAIDAHTAHLEEVSEDIFNALEQAEKLHEAALKLQPQTKKED